MNSKLKCILKMIICKSELFWLISIPFSKHTIKNVWWKGKSPKPKNLSVYTIDLLAPTYFLYYKIPSDFTAFILFASSSILINRIVLHHLTLYNICRLLYLSTYFGTITNYYYNIVQE